MKLKEPSELKEKKNIIVEFVSYDNRNKVFRNKKHLRDKQLSITESMEL